MENKDIHVKSESKLEQVVMGGRLVNYKHEEAEDLMVPPASIFVDWFFKGVDKRFLKLNDN